MFNKLISSLSLDKLEFESEISATFSANATYNNKYCSQTFMDEVMNLKFWKERKKSSLHQKEFRRKSSNEISYLISLHMSF